VTPDPNDWLVVLQVSSRRLTATVAQRGSDGERVVAHRAIECDWLALEERSRSEAVADVLSLACDSAGVRPMSVFVSVADPSLRANFATGYADLGEELLLTSHERSLALARATHQAIGTEREVLHALPQRWSVRSVYGEREVDEPVGERASRLTCHVLLVTADRRTRLQMEGILDEFKIYLEGMIAQPVALYRGLASDLPRKGSTLVIDCGARHTSLLVHRKQRLVHVETHAFGGDHLTQAIVEELGIGWLQAEELKRELDIGVHAQSEEREDQIFLWREIQERHRCLAPAARICADRLRAFFLVRAQALREMELLAQNGKVHLVGRAAALGGLGALLKDLFKMPVVLGAGQQAREASSELADLITVGLVRQAAIERERRLAERRASSIRQVTHAASGLWAWLSKTLD